MPELLSVQEETADMILDVLAQGRVTEEWAIELCLPLCTWGQILSLDRVQKRNRSLWLKLKKEITSRYGNFDFSAERDRAVADTFMGLAEKECFSPEFMEELRRGLRSATGEKRDSVDDDTQRHAANILDRLDSLERRAAQAT